MAYDSKSVGIVNESKYVRVYIKYVLSMYKHVWDLYWIYNMDIKEGNQAVNELDGFSGLTDTTILTNI